MKKLLVMLLTVALTLSCCAFTAMAETEGLTIDVALGYSEPKSMDPNLATGADQFEILVHMYEGLMRYVPSEEAIGTNPNEVSGILACGQAESYDYDEATLTYTFHLRDDICWADGEPVTAQDFVYSWQRLVNPATAASNGAILNDIVVNATEVNHGEKDPSELGIVAVDEKTVQVSLANSCSYFLNLCAQYSLYPLRQDVIEQYGDTWTEAATFMSNGAYVMTEWVHDSYMKLEPNPLYYDAEKVGPVALTFHLSDSETSNLAAYQSGEYDFVSGIPADMIQSLQASGDLFVAPRINVTYLYMNLDETPDWRVRAAFMLAIDRDNIVNNVTQDGATPATGLIPVAISNSEGIAWPEVAGTVMFDWLQEQYPDFDLSSYVGRCILAQQLLADAEADGYDTSKTVMYFYNTSETNKAIAEAVQADLANVLGLNVVLNNLDSAGYTDKLSQGGFHLGRLGYGVSYNDAIGYYNLFSTNGTFEYSGWSNEEYDALVAQAKTMVGGAERDEVMLNIEKIMFTDAGFSVCPLFYASYSFCMNSALQGVYYTPTSSLSNFTYAYVD